jgi:hypothetical protein
VCVLSPRGKEICASSAVRCWPPHGVALVGGSMSVMKHSPLLPKLLGRCVLLVRWEQWGDAGCSRARLFCIRRRLRRLRLYSKIALHAQKCNHDINFVGTELLAHENNYRKRNSKEAVAILSQNNTFSKPSATSINPI